MPRAWPAFCKALGLAGILNRSGIALGEHRLASPHSRLATRPAIGALLLMAKGFQVVLISTYDLGRQPFGLASPAAFLRRAGHQVVCADLTRTKLPEDAVRRAALPIVARVRAVNPTTHLCAFGLYAPLNATLLREHGVQTVLGPEFEEDL